MKNFLILFQLLPNILQSVFTLRTVANVPGEAKKEMILHTISVAAQIGEKVPIPLVSGISLLIDKVVDTINSSEITVPDASTINPVTGAMIAAQQQTKK